MKPYEVIAQIAKDHLSIPTLHARNSDSLDFHVLAVWSIRKALHAAYLAGMQAEKSRSES